MVTSQIPIEDSPSLLNSEDIVDAEDTGAAGASGIVAEGTAVEAPAPAEATPETPQTPEASEPSYVPPTHTVPSQEQFLQQELTRERQARQYMEQQQQQLQIAQDAMVYRQQLEQQGLPQEQVEYLSQQRQQQQMQQINYAKAFQNQRDHYEGKMKAALYYAQRHPGTDPMSLLEYDSPQSMEVAARQASEIAGLKKEIAAIKRGSVPAGQTFDNNQSAGGDMRNDQNWFDQVYGDPEHIASPAEHERAKKYLETLQ